VAIMLLHTFVAISILHCIKHITSMFYWFSSLQVPKSLLTTDTTEKIPFVPALCGTQCLITKTAIACPWSLFWAKQIQSTFTLIVSLRSVLSYTHICPTLYPLFYTFLQISLRTSLSLTYMQCDLPLTSSLNSSSY
jgi:hypothetical protein